MGSDFTPYVVEQGRRAFPLLELDLDGVTAHLSLCQAAPKDDEAAADLFLAAGCAAGHGAALELFEARVMGPLRKTVARIDGSPDFIEEALQELRVRLFLPPGEKIALFKGQSSLLSWARVVAARVALNLKAPAASGEEVAQAVSMANHDVELDFFRRRCGHAFNVAFRSALESLSVQEKTLLQMYVGQRMNVGHIGRVLQVDRSTVVRWVVRARQKILAATRGHLAHALSLSASEISSVVRALQSEVNVSLTQAITV